MPIELFDRLHLTAAPWQNGGGVTREIVRRPALADAYDWRVSIAQLTRDGPFSIFSGYDRIIMLLDGDGVRLQSTDRAADDDIDHYLNRSLTPFAFGGERGIHATLIGGASTDFNVITRRATVSARLHISRTSEHVAASRGGVLFAAHGTWLASPTRAHSIDDSWQESELRQDTGLWWDDDPLTWSVRPAGEQANDAMRPPELVVVSIRER